MTETAPDILSMVEDASEEWRAPQGRKTATPSPYLPLVAKSVTDAGDTFAAKSGKPLGITVTLNGKSVEDRTADLQKHVNAFRKAGRQHDPAVSVLVQTGDIAKDGKCRILFKARPKITRKASETPAPAESAPAA